MEQAGINTNNVRFYLPPNILLIEANQYICMLKRNIPSDHFVPLVSKMVYHIGTSINGHIPMFVRDIVVSGG